MTSALLFIHIRGVQVGVPLALGLTSQLSHFLEKILTNLLTASD